MVRDRPGSDLTLVMPIKHFSFEASPGECTPAIWGSLAKLLFDASRSIPYQYDEIFQLIVLESLQGDVKANVPYDLPILEYRQEYSRPVPCALSHRDRV